ncbi:hypothetical protein [uncultured Fusobacterium sp.]|uniref:capsular polysaccharide export protein, LipB/KpsS family n=1 Tax=uncultured Fusobacterium sp. TaxID=159267 RepID=UPI0027DDEAEE|nr:hypothetical protein [uncultured Fusobacterium sp.]
MNEVLEFIEFNKEYWKKIKSNNEKEIIIPMLMNYPTEIEYTMRIAKTLQEKMGYKIIVLLNRKSEYQDIIKSYGVDEIKILLKTRLNIRILFLSFFRAAFLFFKNKSLTEIENIIYKDIKIGDLVYDSYIRDNSVFTFKKCFKSFLTLTKALINTECYCKILNNENIEYIILRDKLYITHGIFCRCAVKENKKILLYRSNIKFINESNIYKHIFYPSLSLSEIHEEIGNKNYLIEIDNYFIDKFKGKITSFDSINAYNNKKIYSKNEIIDALKLDKEKKIVVIMAHAFSDAPHVGKSIYSDYYIWIKETLKIVKDLNEVNWVIKEHPSSFWYGEKNIVREIIEKNEIKNVTFYSNNLSTAGIKNIADCIITDKGTAGLEFACFGIPCVLAGESYYSGYGFSHEVKSKEEYKNILKNIKNIKKLNEEQINNAKLLYYYIYIYHNDEVSYIKKPVITEKYEEINIFKDVLKNNKIHSIYENILYKSTRKMIETKTLKF